MPIKLDENGQPIQNINDKVLPEQDTRKKILNKCKKLGCYQEMIQIFQKYDKLLHNCTNEKERADIAKLGIYEAYVLMEKGGKLYIQNNLIYVDKDCKSNDENEDEDNDPKIII